MSCCLRTRKHFQETDSRETFMLKNGKILLEKFITSCNGVCNPIHGYSIRELEIATDYYDARKVIRDGYVFKLYKGFLQDHTISIMKFNDILDDGHEDCFNNIIFALQLSVHKNVLKLIGCCLETPIPVLVFEAVQTGTLADHIYLRHSHFEPLLLTQRLKIAMEIANVIAYLHVGFSRPILFRNIRPSRILLDEDCVAKLFDFSLSIRIPEGETYIKDTMVAGEIGFIAPEYLLTGDCNEKCDVFSFGVLLLVLLTGQKIYDHLGDETGAGYWLLNRVKNYVENNRFHEIVDPLIIREGICTRKEKKLQAFTELALGCVCESAKDRPTMIDVAKQLMQMYRQLS